MSRERRARRRAAAVARVRAAAAAAARAARPRPPRAAVAERGVEREVGVVSAPATPAASHRPSAPPRRRAAARRERHGHALRRVDHEDGRDARAARRRALSAAAATPPPPARRSGPRAGEAGCARVAGGGGLAVARAALDDDELALRLEPRGALHPRPAAAAARRRRARRRRARRRRARRRRARAAAVAPPPPVAAAQPHALQHAGRVARALDVVRMHVVVRAAPRRACAPAARSAPRSPRDGRPRLVVGLAPAPRARRPPLVGRERARAARRARAAPAHSASTKNTSTTVRLGSAQHRYAMSMARDPAAVSAARGTPLLIVRRASPVGLGRQDACRQSSAGPRACRYGTLMLARTLDIAVNQYVRRAIPVT